MFRAMARMNGRVRPAAAADESGTGPDDLRDEPDVVFEALGIADACRPRR